MKLPNSQLLGTLFFLYFTIIHVFVGIALFKTDIIPRLQTKLGFKVITPELTPFFHTMLSMHRRIDENIPDNSVIFIGDSITQGLAVSSVAPVSVNFGIGHDTTFGALQRIPYYTSLSRARATVLAIGVNDIKKRANKEILENYTKIIRAIPSHTPVLISAVMPVNEIILNKPGFNTRILEINKELKNYCEQDPHLHCLNIGPLIINASGNLSNDYHIGDGIHLNKVGYRIWISKLKDALFRINNQINL